MTPLAFRRRFRYRTALLALATMLFAHAAMAIGACLEHVQVPSAAPHSHVAAAPHSHVAPAAHTHVAIDTDSHLGLVHSSTGAAHSHAGVASDADHHATQAIEPASGGSEDPACRLQCEAQVQARDQIKTFELSAAVGHAGNSAPPLLLTASPATPRAAPGERYRAAAPPPPLTIVFSRFQI